MKVINNVLAFILTFFLLGTLAAATSPRAPNALPTPENLSKFTPKRTVIRIADPTTCARGTPTYTNPKGGEIACSRGSKLDSSMVLFAIGFASCVIASMMVV